MARPRTVHAFSAGGVLFRRAPNSVGAPRAEVALVGSSAGPFWVLPKGTPLEGETNEQAAVREVAEETGVRGRILGELGSIHYWFSRQGTRFNKEVLYYVMLAEDGDTALHDHEYEEARWFPLSEAKRLLTYPNEVALIGKAEPRIAVELAGERA